MRVLIVDDEQRFTEVLGRGLREAGHQVVVRHTGPDGLLTARTEIFDAVVLDWMLPGQDGPSVCRALRERGIRTPVLMLTARHAVPDRIAGLDAGADDYLPKPFSFDELLARLRALGRRLETDVVFDVGDLHIDCDRRTVARGGTPVELTAREFDVLALLAGRAGKLVTRSDILEEVWDGETDLRSNVIDVYIANIRTKIDRPFGRASIHTLRGAGYRLDDTTD
ncbi:response regulator transcription factor (plasmid) [Rhodococcus sp. ZPP]|uniref:response regulator transcription factor n=1 Tax=Rhodococcus sp. ZPP TaxID=2749906 RepID=UPI001AD865CB|nr:response regulator transcription factor [Rhodococcus sp. ZPP]QTJ71432.1 response regulator transcription factor [Rhodococcus sp. ZPP]